MPGLILHPTVRARGIQVDIRAEIANHQSFPKVARAKMRNHERKLRELHCDAMKINRIGIAHVEVRGKSQLLADSHAQHTTVDERESSRLGCGSFEYRQNAFIHY